jgi:hypothetical protein
MSSRTDQADWFDRLAEQSHIAAQGVTQTLFFARCKSDNRPGAWLDASLWDWRARPDFRSVLWNEVLFDLDRPIWRHNWSTAIRLDNYLRARAIPRYWFASGGKGLHCSVFLYAGGAQSQLGWERIRTAVWERMCREARIVSDPMKIRYRDTTMGSLVRMEGGLRYEKPRRLETYDDIFPDGTTVVYKHWLDRPPMERPEVTRPGKVEYPPAIHTWSVPSSWLPPPAPPPVRYEREVVSDVRPVIRKLIEFMATGGNLNDFGRFAVAVHVLRAGWSPADATELYRGTPNFNAAFTRKRLESVASHLDRVVVPGRKAILEKVGPQVPGLEQ